MIPDKFTFVPLINAYANLQSLEEGRHVHTQIIQNGCESDPYVGNSLIHMYAKCGSIEDAWSFNNTSTHDVVLWNAMILGQVKCGQVQNACQLYQQMQFEGLEPDPITYAGVLNACASLGTLMNGGMFIISLFIVDLSLMYLWLVVSLTCMPNVGAQRMHGKCSMRPVCAMWSVGVP
jgi:pentatricopeptide repeat protein